MFGYQARNKLIVFKLIMSLDIDDTHEIYQLGGKLLSKCSRQWPATKAYSDLGVCSAECPYSLSLRVYLAVSVYLSDWLCVCEYLRFIHRVSVRLVRAANTPLPVVRRCRCPATVV